jgi:hypothetical protein
VRLVAVAEHIFDVAQQRLDITGVGLVARDLEAAEQVVRRRRQLLGRRLQVRIEAYIVVAAAVWVCEPLLGRGNSLEAYARLRGR